METMKRLFFAIVALTVMFAVGCSKEEFETLAPEYKLVVNMEQASFGDDTRSPRTEWEDGDEVVVVFNGDVREDILLLLIVGVLSGLVRHFRKLLQKRLKLVLPHITLWE